MGLIRILVDGFSLLHSWPELAPGKARHSEAARDELISVLAQYSQVCGTPITVVFDGAGRRGGNVQNPTKSVEVIYSRANQTADDLIERAAQRLVAYGEVLVVTDDFPERDMVSFVGAMYQSCLGFIQTFEAEMADLHREIKNRNFRERSQFKRNR